MKKMILMMVFLFVRWMLNGQNVVFVDSNLQKLINEAIENNTDVRNAALMIEQSDALLKSAKLSLLPSFSLAPNGSLAKSSSGTSESYSIPVSTEWEFSLGGRRKAEREIAQATLEQNRLLAEYSEIEISSAVAELYYTLVMLDRQVSITRESLVNQESSLDAIRAFKAAGKMDELAVNQAQATLQETKASLVELENQVAKTENALLLLLNRENGTVMRSSWESVKSLNIDPNNAVDLESLSKRPDVKAAEMALSVACGNVKIAKADFYPILRISANAGWTDNIGQIVNPAEMLLNLVGSLTQPIFNRGILTANRKVAEVQYKQAQLAFEKALLSAGNEVRNAMQDCIDSQRKTPIRESQVEAGRKAYENCMELMTYSQSVTYLDVLTAHSSYLSAQLQQSSDWMDHQRSLINLYKSLCGSEH